MRLANACSIGLQSGEDGGRKPKRAPAAAGQLGRGGGLIQKDEPCRVALGLPGDPGVAVRHYIGAILFAGRRRLFLKVIR